MEKSVATCIYCGHVGPFEDFPKEHVLPRLMGVFENNLTLVNGVCRTCNSEVFSPLETKFKEDTEEGIFCQMLNFSGDHQIRIRATKAKMQVQLGLGEEFFNETFPFLSLAGGKRQIVFKPQIKVRGYGGSGYIILLVDEVKKLPRDGKKFKGLKNIISGTESKNVSIFVHESGDPDRNELEEAITLVKELGVDYKAGTKKSVPFSEPSPTPRHAEFSLDGRIDADIARVLAKIAFNYFAYCAINSGNQDILKDPAFEAIKSYILGKNDLPLKEVIIIKPTYEGILGEEAQGHVRFVGHVVTFSNEGGRVIARISLMGRLSYTILLGSTPALINRADLGNGHIFDPNRHKIFGLTRNAARRGTENGLRFDLFNGF